MIDKSKQCHSNVFTQKLFSQKVCLLPSMTAALPCKLLITVEGMADNTSTTQASL